MASLSRRQFVMGAAVLGGTLALGGCAPQNKEEGAATGDAGEGLSADIVVIGSGLAGEACARSAAQNGAKVILVDKAPFIGSTFQTSMGNVSICQVPENEDYWQFTDGETDTMDAFLTRYRAATETGKVDAPYPDYDRVQAVMQASCETISWLEEIGVDFQQSFTKDQVGTDTVKPDVSAAAAGQVGGALFVEKMQAELENLGVNIMLSTEATELIQEGDAVTGVRVDGPDGNQDIMARAVVLAVGGFGGSKEYCDQLVPAINKIGFQYQGNALNTGDGMTMAKAVGAALYDDCWVIPNVIVPSRALTAVDQQFSLICDPSVWGQAFEGGHTSDKLLVDAAGTRFINEASPAIALATTMADRDAAPYYVLFDGSDAEVTALLEKGLDTGDVIKAESVEQLAQDSGVAGLADTFATYQAAAAAGTDGEFNKKAENLVPYQEGPFYLVSYVPSYVATMGGVKTDANCQAVREDGSAIDGLYAIGETTHRFMYNRSFVRHCSNSSALTMGRLTGEALAQA